MKTSKQLLALAALALIGCPLAESKQSPFTMTMHALTPENGLTTSAKADSIVLEVTMLNSSDHAVLIFEGNPVEDYVIDIRDSSGVRPADTDFGLRLKKSVGSPFRLRNMALRLKPGESGTDVIPIGPMYDMRTPGKYFVTVQRRLPKELGLGMVKSNEMVITVTR